MNIVLVSLYDLGRQPFGLASPAAWLREAGHGLTAVDLSVDRFPQDAIAQADLIAFHLPMHTATRMAVPAIGRVRKVNPRAHICCYGLYAPLNAGYLRGLGAQSIIGGEYEPALLRLANSLEEGQPAGVDLISLERIAFRIPDRSGLPPLSSYAPLRIDGEARPVGYTEASRGCKHLCRHCPIVPVYQGAFRVVPGEIVLADIRRQVAVGARHITFGDPDFFNGPTHGMKIAEAMHAEFPDLTYDATIKIEHLRKGADLIPALKETGCLFVTSAVESFDDVVLEKLAKGHVLDDFLGVLGDFRRHGLTLSPTFIAFTPWTTIESYGEFLRTLRELDLERVSPVQLALRLLIPAGSGLLELEDVRAVMKEFDPQALLHRWSHPDPGIDRLAGEVLRIAGSETPRREIFGRVWERVFDEPLPPRPRNLLPRAEIPYLDEPWYC